MTPASPNGRLSNVSTAEAPVRGTPAALPADAGGGLLKASLQAAAGFAVLFAGLTLGPYFWDKSQAATKGEPAAPAAKGEPKPAEPQPPTAPSPSPAAPDAKGAAGAPVVGKPPAKGDIVDKLGENATKTAPTKVNPLDKKDDDLLKDIK
jgi:hypothetical protein